MRGRWISVTSAQKAFVSKHCRASSAGTDGTDRQMGNLHERQFESIPANLNIFDNENGSSRHSSPLRVETGIRRPCTVHEMPGSARVSFELLPKPDDVSVNRAGIGNDSYPHTEFSIISRVSARSGFWMKYVSRLYSARVNFNSSPCFETTRRVRSDLDVRKRHNLLVIRRRPPQQRVNAGGAAAEPKGFTT